MSSDSPAKALADAKVWLASAEETFTRSGERSHVVAAAQAIHAIIRANDAITSELIGKKATRHDDAPLLFKQLIREGKLPAGSERFALLLFRSMESKSGADYGRGDIGKWDAEYFVTGAREFVALAEKCIPK